MTNIESGSKLLKEAGIYLKEMEENFKAGEWNISIRKAQDVVELSFERSSEDNGGRISQGS